MNPQAKLGLTVDSKDLWKRVARRNQPFASPSRQLFKCLLALRVVATCKVIVKQPRLTRLWPFVSLEGLLFLSHYACLWSEAEKSISWHSSFEE